MPGTILPTDGFAELLQQRALVRLWSAWLFGVRAGQMLMQAVGFHGVCMIGFGWSTQLLVSLLLLALSGATDMGSVVLRQTLLQLETPELMRGRVSPVSSIFIGASNQLGEFESGATAPWFGPVGSVLLGGVGTLCIAALWCRLFPALLRRDRMPHP